MRPLRDVSLLFSLAVALALTGCEPGTTSAGQPGNAGGLPSCCEEPTPSLAEARKEAMKKEALKEEALPAAPSRVDTPPAKTTAEIPGVPGVPGVSEPKDREAVSLDFTFTDQDGKPFELKSIKGTPTVATFIFTKCPNPNMCPLQGAKMAALQKELDKAGLTGKVNLLLFTFDPDYDTPERLKKWGETSGLKFTEHVKMLRPDPREFLDFKDAFGFRAFVSNGELNHKTDLFLLDAQGRIAAFYGGMWDDAKVWGEVQKLIGESQIEK